MNTLVRETGFDAIRSLIPSHDVRLTVNPAHIIVLLFSLLFISTGSVEGQQKRSGNIITGTVIDAHSGEKLPFASIGIKNTGIGTTSNVEGYFTLLDLPDEALILVVSYVGYAMVEIPVEPASQPAPLIVALESASYQMEEVTVSGKSYHMIESAREVSMIKVAPQDLSVLPNFGEVDVFRSLQLLPGVGGTNERSSGLYIRGSTPDQNLVLFDGMTVYNVDHFYGFFSAFNANAIKDIQLYKGGFPASYGGRSSGIVDITGKSGDVEHFRADMGLNLLSGNAAVEIPLLGKGSVLLAGRRSFTDFLESRTYRSILNMFEAGKQEAENPQAGDRFQSLSGTTTSIEPEFYFYDFNGKISIKPGYKDHFSASVYAGDDHLKEGQNVLVTPSLRNGDTARLSRALENEKLTRWGNLGASTKWSRQWSPRWFSNIQMAYSQYESDYFNKNRVEIIDNQVDSVIRSTWREGIEENRVKDITARTDFEWQAGSKSKFNFGTWSNLTGIRYDYIRSIYRVNRSDSLRALYPDSTIYNVISDTILSQHQSSWLHTVFIQHTWEAAPSLQIIYGLRSTYYSMTDKIYLDPRLSLQWKALSGLTLKAASGKYHQFVNQVINEDVTQGSRDFYLLPDGGRIPVGYSWHYIMGVSYELPGFLFDVELYHKSLHGLSEFSLRYRRSNRAIEELFYSGDGYAQGLDVLLQKKSGRISGWISYSLGKVIHRFPALNGGYDFHALHDQRHELKIVSVFSPTPKWDFSATWICGSGMPYTMPDAQYSLFMLDETPLHYISVGSKNAERLPPYHRLDLAVNYHIKAKKFNLDIGVSFFNLYNRKNIWYRKFDLEELPIITTDVTYLGFLPNLSIHVNF